MNMPGHGPLFEQMEFDRLRDEDYREQVAEERRTTRVPCHLCVGGKVIVKDGGFDGIAICGYCTNGWVLTEQRT
jgi:hypothetical protein